MKSLLILITRILIRTILFGVVLCNYPVRSINQKFEARVVNGQLSNIIDFSYCAFVKIGAKNQQPWTCGSSILNQYTLLTAAHCLFESDPAYIFVKTGNAHRKNGSKSFVSRFHIHQNYNEGQLGFDIALIKLMEPLVFGANIGRVAIMQYPPYNETGKIAGWGFLDEQRLNKSILLQHTTQKIKKRRLCQKILGVLPKGVICGGAKNQASYAAMGDSGSALVVKGYIQVGLVSYKLEKISKSLVIYTDIGYFFSWIEANALEMLCSVEENT